MIRLIKYFFAYISFWDFKNISFSQKRKKVIRRTKLRTKQQKKHLSNKTELVVFKDDKGTVCFSVLMEALFYIEADINYINIFYHNQGKLEKYLMRSSLKTVLEQNTNENLVRCHRSYIVNFEKVQLYKKEKEGSMIGLTNESVPLIPVSKSYLEDVLRKFQFQ